MTLPPAQQRPALRILTIEEVERLPLQKERGVERIELNGAPVKARGEALHEIWWRGKQWAVTAFGIECLDGTYFVEAKRLLEDSEYLWPQHMSEKSWVDIDEFTTAWMVGLLLHGKAGKIAPAAIREVFARLRPIRRQGEDDEGFE